MNKRFYVNSFKTTLASAIGPDDVTIPVASVMAVTTSHPTILAGEYFLVTIDDGVKFEILEVHGVSGTNLTSCVRGLEGTTRASFAQGTRVEARVTAGTLSAFARLTERLGDIATVDALPVASDFSGNSCLVAELDDGGCPIMALKTGNQWKFPSYPTAVLTGTVGAAGTTTSANVGSTTFVASTPALTAGAYIISFITGNNAGLCRKLTTVSSTDAIWATALPLVVASGDAFVIYQSLSTSLAAAISAQDDNVALALIFSE
jgi:hypothetical protein